MLLVPIELPTVEAVAVLLIVDAEQDLVLLHEVALLHRDLEDHAGDPGEHVGLLVRLERGRGAVVARDGAALRLIDRHRGSGQEGGVRLAGHGGGLGVARRGGAGLAGAAQDREEAEQRKLHESREAHHDVVPFAAARSSARDSGSNSRSPSEEPSERAGR